jgi:hypothetical protein
MLVYHLWRVLYFGDIFPNTYYAKVGGDNILALGWSYLERFIIARPYHLVLLIAVLLLGGSASRTGVRLTENRLASSTCCRTDRAGSSPCMISSRRLS